MDSNTAATIIQSYFRRHLAKRIYSQELLEKFQRDEAVRHEKEQLQVSEGELLVTRYKLRMEIIELETITSNKQRHLNTMATRIQRAWRAHTDQSPVSSASHASRATNSTRNAVLNNNALNTDVNPSYDQCQVIESVVSNRAQPALSHTRENGYPSTGSKSATYTPSHTMDALSFESKYRLCFTSDLSESSGEEQEPVVSFYNTAHSNDKLLNDQRYEEREYDSVLDGQKEESSSSIVSLERHLKELVSTSNDLIFSDEFENTSFIGNQSNSEMDCYSDSVTLRLNVDPSPSLLMHSTILNRTPVTHDGLNMLTLQHSHHQTFDHSGSSLHAMTTQQLREFIKQVHHKMKEISKELISLLIARDELNTQNRLLHQNIARLARNTQSLYSRGVSIGTCTRTQ